MNYNYSLDIIHLGIYYNMYMIIMNEFIIIIIII